MALDKPIVKGPGAQVLQMDILGQFSKQGNCFTDEDWNLSQNKVAD